MTHGRRNLALVGLAIAVLLVAATLVFRLVDPTEGASHRSVATAPSSAPASPSETASASSAPVSSPTLSPGDHDLSVTAAGMKRDFTLHVPAGLGASDRPALVMVFHGAYDTAEETKQMTGLDAAADAGHYLVAYLQGYQNSWNDLAGHSAAQAAGVDDLAFASAAVTDIEGLHPVDSSRVAAVGFSNGGLFADLLGCRLPQMFRVIVPIEGSLPVNVGRSCAPTAPVSVLDVEGTNDQTIPYEGGSFSGMSGKVTVMSAPAAVARWAQLDGCSSSQKETQLDANTKLATYQGCKDGVTVSLRTLAGGTHEWPPQPELAQIVTAALAAFR